MSNQPEFKKSIYQDAICCAEYNILLNKIYKNRVSCNDIEKFITEYQMKVKQAIQDDKKMLLLSQMERFGYILLKLRNNNYENIYEKSFNLIMLYVQDMIKNSELDIKDKKTNIIHFLNNCSYDIKALRLIFDYHKSMWGPNENKTLFVNELMTRFIKSFNTIICNNMQKNTPEHVHDVIKTLLAEGARTEDLLSSIVSLEYPYNETILNTVLASPDCHLDQISDQASYTILQNTISYYASEVCLPTSNIINNLLNKGLCVNSIDPKCNLNMALYMLCTNSPFVNEELFINIAESLILHGADLNSINSDKGLSIIETAKRNLSPAKVVILNRLTGIELENEISEVDKRLISGIMRKSVVAVKKALAEGANPNTCRDPDDKKIPVLFTAISNLDVENVNTLISAGSNLDIRDANGLPINNYLYKALYSSIGAEKRISQKTRFNNSFSYTYNINNNTNNDILTCIDNAKKNLPRLLQILTSLKIIGHTVPEGMIQESLTILSKYISSYQLNKDEMEFYDVIKKFILDLKNIGADINSIYVESKFTDKYLYDRYFHENFYKSNNRLKSLIAEACSSLNYSVAKLLLECNADPNADPNKLVYENLEDRPFNPNPDNAPIICALYAGWKLKRIMGDNTNKQYYKIMEDIIYELVKYNADVSPNSPIGKEFLSMTSKNNPSYPFQWQNSAYPFQWQNSEEIRDRLHNIKYYIANQNIESMSNNKDKSIEFNYDI